MASRYLRDRSSLDHVPSEAGIPTLRSRRFPTAKSLKTYGEALTNFLDWCEARKLPWESVDYQTHLLDRYQVEMARGSWSASNHGLASSTINSRVAEACRFLSWAADRGLRPDFKVNYGSARVYLDSGTSVHGHKSTITKQRIGDVRKDPVTLRLPSDNEVALWHKSLRARHGLTKALVCELILKTGIRREEAAQWRLNTLPEDRSDWRVTGDAVTVLIRHGTKGPKSVDEFGDEVGPARSILLPLELANRLEEYRHTVRPRLRAKLVRAAPTMVERKMRMKEVPKSLFLSDFDGRPVSASSIYSSWTETSNLPFKGWCPHQGRHYYACKTLLDSFGARMRAAKGTGISDMVRQGFHGTAMDILKIRIQPQLGHLSVEVTQAYLVWVQRALTLTSVSDEYEQSLDSMVSTEMTQHQDV